MSLLLSAARAVGLVSIAPFTRPGNMAPRFEIRFDDNPQGVFNGGQTLSGSVELRLKNPKSVNDFRLVISGCAEVKWSEGSGKHRRDYYGKEELMRAETYLIPQRHGNTEIAAGVHVYNFASPIPTQVPTSFEGKHGKIRYTVQAILDRPWKFNQTSTVAFTLLKPLDLNLHLPTLKERRKENLTKTFCCWPCSSSPLFVGVQIPVTGYVPGQKIPITVELNNTSSASVLSIDSKLKRKVSYVSLKPEKTRVEGENLAMVRTTLSNDEPVQFTQNIEIPSIVPTGYCSVLIIDYILQVKVCVDGCHRNPKINIPITIGTVPFMTSPTTAGPNFNQVGWTDELLSPTAPESPGSDDILPPSYEQAMNGMVVHVKDEQPNAIGALLRQWTNSRHISTITQPQPYSNRMT